MTRFINSIRLNDFFFYQFFQPKYKIAIKKNLKELDVWVWWPNVPGHKKTARTPRPVCIFLVLKGRRVHPIFLKDNR